MLTIPLLPMAVLLVRHSVPSDTHTHKACDSLIVSSLFPFSFESSSRKSQCRKINKFRTRFSTMRAIYSAHELRSFIYGILNARLRCFRFGHGRIRLSAIGSRLCFPQSMSCVQCCEWFYKLNIIVNVSKVEYINKRRWKFDIDAETKSTGKRYHISQNKQWWTILVNLVFAKTILFFVWAFSFSSFYVFAIKIDHMRINLNI